MRNPYIFQTPNSAGALSELAYCDIGYSPESLLVEELDSTFGDEGNKIHCPMAEYVTNDGWYYGADGDAVPAENWAPNEPATGKQAGAYMLYDANVDEDNTLMYAMSTGDTTSLQLVVVCEGKC